MADSLAKVRADYGPRIAALEAAVAALQKPAAPTTGPMSEPWFPNPPAPPAGLAARTITLAKAIADTPPGGVLNAAVGGLPFAEYGIQRKSLITILMGKPGTPQCSGFAPMTMPVQWLSFLSPAASGSVLEGGSSKGNGVQPGARPGPNDAEWGAIQIGGFEQGTVDRVVLRNVQLGDGAHDLINIQGGSGHSILGCDLDRAGKACVTGSGSGGWTVRNSRAQHANTIDAIDTTTGKRAIGDSAGMKLLVDGTGNTFTGNELAFNATRGVWWDSPSAGWSIFGNSWHDNAFQGIFGETLHDGSVHDNAGHHNSLDPANDLDYRGGLSFMCPARLDVYNNVEAWSGAGLTVNVDTNRGDDQKPHAGLHVHDNTLIVVAGRYALRFAGNPADTFWFPASGNTAMSNGISSGALSVLLPVATAQTFVLTAAQQTAALIAAGLPAA